MRSRAWRLSDLLMPADNPPFRQPVERHRSEFRPDPCRYRSVEAIGRLAAAALVIDTIVDEGVGYGVRAIERHKIARLFPRLALEPSARPLLRLREAEHAKPVRVADIVGGAERLRDAACLPRRGTWQSRCPPWHRVDIRARFRPRSPSNRARAARATSRGRNGCRSSGCEPCGPCRSLSLSQNVRQIYGRDVGEQGRIAVDGVIKNTIG